MQINYTGHEHLNYFGFINMNGRMYGYSSGRMFSPDNYVQAPHFTQSYNRYSYCWNNPLKYTDPSGEFIFSALLPGIGFFIDAACWGAVIGGAGYTAQVAMSDGGFNNWSWSNFGKAAAFGAVSGVATAGIGAAFGGVGGGMTGLNAVGHEVGRAMAHGMVQGTLSMMQGGDFMQGAAAGMLGSLGGSAFQKYGGEFAQSVAGTVFFSSMSGGMGSIATGGDFWRGATTGAIIGLLNHGAHMVQQQAFDKQYGIVRDKQGNITKIAGTDVYGSALLDDNAAFTAPGIGIFAGSEAQKDLQLLMHEFGHVLQANKIGIADYYLEIAPASVKSFLGNRSMHPSFWTERNANGMSYKYFGRPANWQFRRYPVK